MDDIHFKDDTIYDDVAAEYQDEIDAGDDIVFVEEGTNDDLTIQHFINDNDLRDGVNELSEGFFSRKDEIGSVQFASSMDVETNQTSLQQPDRSDLAQGYSEFTDDEIRTNFPELYGQFVLHAKIGEGTYSSVYFGRKIPKNPPLGWFDVDPLELLDHPTEDCFALKRIYPTSSSAKVLAEIKLLKLLGGKDNVIKLVGGVRLQDQITLVMPIYDAQPPKEYFPELTTGQLRRYMFSLFTALAHVHEHGIIHRDVKPTNFLYSRRTEKFVLVDFGLAQYQEELHLYNSVVRAINSHMDNEYFQHQARQLGSDLPAPDSSQYPPSIQEQLARLPSELQTKIAEDTGRRKRLMIPRAGTRGFRAPEVLLRYADQTTAIDIWAAGVILLCLLSQKYPFFVAVEDGSALCEIASTCGSEQLKFSASVIKKRLELPRFWKKCRWASLCPKIRNRLGVTELVGLPDSVYDLLDRCLDTNPHTRITAKEALQHPFLAVATLDSDS